MSQWKQIGIVVLLAVAATIVLLYRLPGVQEGFAKAFNTSFTQEYNRAYQDAVNKAGQKKASVTSPGSNPKGQIAASNTPTITPDTVTQLRKQLRLQRVSPTSIETIGEQLDTSFRDHTWHVGELPDRTKVLRFEGLLSPDGAAEVRQSLKDAISSMRLTTQRDMLEEALDEIQPGETFQLDFSILPNGQPGKLKRLGVGNATLSGAGLPMSAWLERILQ